MEVSFYMETILRVESLKALWKKSRNITSKLLNGIFQVVKGGFLGFR